MARRKSRWFAALVASVAVVAVIVPMDEALAKRKSVRPKRLQGTTTPARTKTGPLTAAEVGPPRVIGEFDTASRHVTVNVEYVGDLPVVCSRETVDGKVYGFRCAGPRANTIEIATGYLGEFEALPVASTLVVSGPASAMMQLVDGEHRLAMSPLFSDERLGVQWWRYDGVIPVAARVEATGRPDIAPSFGIPGRFRATKAVRGVLASGTDGAAPWSIVRADFGGREVHCFDTGGIEYVVCNVAPGGDSPVLLVSTRPDGVFVAWGCRGVLQSVEVPTVGGKQTVAFAPTSDPQWVYAAVPRSSDGTYTFVTKRGRVPYGSGGKGGLSDGLRAWLEFQAAVGPCPSA